MAILNRTLDASEQRHAFHMSYGTVATGVTLQALIVPFNSTLESVQIAAVGLSAAPTYDLRVWRFIVGTGVTSIAGSATTLTSQAVGTSGVQGMVLAAAGNTLLQLLSGDVITLTSGASNAAVAQLGVGICIRAVQDIKKVYGA